MNESEKRDNYLYLARELRKPKKISMMSIPIVIVVLGKRYGRVGNQRTNHDHPDYRSARILRRVLVTREDLLLLRLHYYYYYYTRKTYNNNNNNNNKSKLANKEYKSRNAIERKEINLQLYKLLNSDHSFKNSPTRILGKKMNEISWDFEIKTEHPIPARKPNLVDVFKKKLAYQQADFATPADKGIKIKESEKVVPN